MRARVKKVAQKNEIKMSQTEVYCNKVECLQVTIERKYLLNRLEISKKFLLPVIIKSVFLAYLLVFLSETKEKIKKYVIVLLLTAI